LGIDAVAITAPDLRYLFSSRDILRVNYPRREHGGRYEKVHPWPGWLHRATPSAGHSLGTGRFAQHPTRP